jgi:hypothetical protein
MADDRALDLPQGTLDLLILKTIGGHVEGRVARRRRKRFL